MNLSDSFRVLLAQLKLELEQLASRTEEMDRAIQKSARENEACQRLTEKTSAAIPDALVGLLESYGTSPVCAIVRNLTATLQLGPAADG